MTTNEYQYAYDGHGRLVVERFLIDGVLQSHETTHWDGDNRLAEFNPSGEITRYYTSGPGPNEVLAVDQNGQTAWALHDQIGSVVAWAEYDSSEWEVQYFEFDSFGNLQSATGSLTLGALPTIWAGHQLDEGTGYYHAQWRWYDPETGQFLSQDPILDDNNAYRYTGNDPANKVDPTGLAKVQAVERLLNLIIDKKNAEFILDNGRRINIRNAKFFDSTVSLDDLESLTRSTRRLLTPSGKNSQESKLNTKGHHPDFSPYRVGKKVRLDNPIASNYSDQAWKAFRENQKKEYAKIAGRSEDFVWHHAPDGSLELVDKELHTAFQHTGSASILRSYRDFAAAGFAVLIAFTPGGDAFAAGDIDRGLRDASVDLSPLGLSQDGADMVGMFFEEAQREVKKQPGYDFRRNLPKYDSRTGKLLESSYGGGENYNKRLNQIERQEQNERDKLMQEIWKAAERE